MENKFELVSFSLCPYVQRSVITLNHKQVRYSISYIDLAAPPAWFLEISPMGKVPLLKLKASGGEHVLFESAVINEYLDEVTPPALIAADPLQKAKERAWVEISSELFGKLHQTYSSTGKESAEKAQEGIWKLLRWIEKNRRPGAYFRGTSFSLVDSAFAPFFLRLFLLPALKESPRWKDLPQTRLWAETLLALPEVKKSVREDFEAEFGAFLKKLGSWFAA